MTALMTILRAHRILYKYILFEYYTKLIAVDIKSWVDNSEVELELGK